MAILSPKMPVAAIFVLQIGSALAKVGGAHSVTERGLTVDLLGKCGLTQGGYRPDWNEVSTAARDQCGIHMSGPKFVDYITTKIIPKRQYWFEQSRLLQKDGQNKCRFEANGQLNCEESYTCKGSDQLCYHYRNEFWHFDYDCQVCKGKGGLYQDCCDTCKQAQRNPSLVQRPGLTGSDKIDSVNCLHCSDAEIQGEMANDASCHISTDGSWTCSRSGSCQTELVRNSTQTGLSQSTKDIECNVINCGECDGEDRQLKANCCGYCLGSAAKNSPSSKVRYACLGCSVGFAGGGGYEVDWSGSKTPRWLVGLLSLAAMAGIAMLLCFCCQSGQGGSVRPVNSPMMSSMQPGMQPMMTSGPYMSVAPQQAMKTY